MSERRRRHARSRFAAPTLLGILAVIAVVGPGTTSMALLTAETAAGSLQVRGATVHAPTSLTLASVEGASALTYPVSASWTPPATGAAPSRYVVYRKSASDTSWPAEPTYSSVPVQLLDDDPTLTECASYSYRVVSAYKALRSETALEATVVNDHDAPRLLDSSIEAHPDGRAAVSGFLRPGTTFFVHANVRDNCELAPGTVPTVDVSGLAVGDPVALLRAPMRAASGAAADGKTYDFVAGPFTARSELADGGAPVWRVRAVDATQHVLDAPGAAAVVDGTGPRVTGHAVSVGDSDAPGGQMEIRPGGSFRIEARITEHGSGVAPGATVDTSALTDAAGATATPLAGSGGTGADLPYVSPAHAAKTNLVHASTPPFAFQVTDRLGNVSGDVGTATVDALGPQLAGCALATTGGYLRAGATLTLTFDDDMWTGSLFAGWDGAARSINAIAQDGSGDTSDSLTYPGAGLLSGPGQSGHPLGSPSWITGGAVLLHGSIISAADRTWTIVFGGDGTDVRVPPTGERAGSTISLSTNLRDSAGNALIAGGVPCSISGPAAPPEQEDDPHPGQGGEGGLGGQGGSGGTPHPGQGGQPGEGGLGGQGGLGGHGG